MTVAGDSSSLSGSSGTLSMFVGVVGGSSHIGYYRYLLYHLLLLLSSLLSTTTADIFLVYFTTI
ncbi:hypothetical protein J3E69DRAFT_324937 [Trichoderma sp. SZMC 28015]